MATYSRIRIGVRRANSKARAKNGGRNPKQRRGC